jgi:uncharacterized protein DUF222/HNH endonuclease
MFELDKHETVEIEDELASLAASITAATGRFLELLAELERREAWAGQGFTSLAHWLAWRCGLDLRTAREHVRVACAMRDLPRTTQAVCRGELSYSKARAVTRVARPETEEQILETAKYATASQLDRILAVWRRAELETQDAAERMCALRHADLYFDDDGMLVIRARLAPEEGALFMRAMESARDALWKGEPKVGAGARADALALIADRSLSVDAAARSGPDRTTIMVHVDAEVLHDTASDGQSRLEQGPSGPAEQSRRLACDAAVVEVVHGTEGEVSVGRRTRRISAALRRLLSVRDGGICVFPGCTHRIVDAHHIVHWADGGATVPENLISACRFHHVRLHEGGFTVELTAAGVRFRRPDGRLVPMVPAAIHGRGLAPAGSPDSLAPRDFTPRIDWDAISSWSSNF